jgi:hypothetical protein
MLKEHPISIRVVPSKALSIYCDARRRFATSRLRIGLLLEIKGHILIIISDDKGYYLFIFKKYLEKLETI